MANSFLEELMAKNRDQEVRRRRASKVPRGGDVMDSAGNQNESSAVVQSDSGSAAGLGNPRKSRSSLGATFTSKFGSLNIDGIEYAEDDGVLAESIDEGSGIVGQQDAGGVSAAQLAGATSTETDDWELSDEYFTDELESTTVVGAEVPVTEDVPVDDEWELNLTDSDADKDSGSVSAAISAVNRGVFTECNKESTNELAVESTSPPAELMDAGTEDGGIDSWMDGLSDFTPEELAEARFSETVDSSTFKFADSLVSGETRDLAIEELGRNRTYLKEILSLLNDQALSYYKYGCQRIRPTNCASKIIKYFGNPDRSLAGIPRTNLIVIYLLFYTVVAEFLQVYGLDPEIVYRAVFDSLGDIEHQKGFISNIRSQILGTAVEAKLNEAELRNISRTLNLLESASEGLL